MDKQRLTIAVVTEVFFDDPDGQRLRNRLAEAKAAGAELALLPELPLNHWAPGSPDPDPADAEEPRGPRHRAMAAAAREVGIGVLGGVIVRDPATGRRHNEAQLFGADGELLGSYSKIHLPFEEGFWEAAHYEPGVDPPGVMPGFPLPIGIQICSDANRTTGCQLLAAQGAAVIVVPRATPSASWPRWELVLRADAVTSACWVVSVNRPPEGDPSPIGGPSVVIAPDGTVVATETEPLLIATLDGGAVERARRDYPGYLSFFPELYQRAWRDLSSD